VGGPGFLRVIDGGAASLGGAPALRREDWDEWSDRLRVLRYLDFQGEQVAAHVGELTGFTLGHGTIIHRYYNDLDFDHHHTGATGSFDTGTFGGEAMVTDVLQADTLLAGRLFFRPSGLDGVTIGTSGVFDRASGFVEQVFGCTLAAGGEACVLPHLPDNLLILGLDAALPFRHRTVTAYADVNAWALQKTVGETLGVRLDPSPRFSLRAEVNASSQGFTPNVVDPLYAAERLQIQAPAQGGFGGLVAATFQQGIAKGTVVGDWRPGDGAGLFAWLTVQPTDTLVLRGFYGQRHLDSLGAFTRGQGPVWHAAARLAVQGPWFAALTAGRFWHTVAGSQRLDLDVVATVGAELGH
jgi:hypothetical protein